VLVLVVYICPSSVHVVAIFADTVLSPLLCSVPQFFFLILVFFSLSNFIISSKCLKNFIYAASKRCLSLFFNTQTSLPNFSVALAVMLCILNFSLLILTSKCFIFLSLIYTITIRNKKLSLERKMSRKNMLMLHYPSYPHYCSC